MVPNSCVSRKVFLKHQVNWNIVCGAIQDLSWHNIWLADNPVEVLNERLSLLIGRYDPTKVISVCNKEKSWFDMLSASSRRLIFDGPVIALGLMGTPASDIKKVICFL